MLSLYFEKAKIITLRAIALKPTCEALHFRLVEGEDHNATSYSTETYQCSRYLTLPAQAKIITLRAIALKLESRRNSELEVLRGEDHNATSYSTETSRQMHSSTQRKYAKIITLRAIALKPLDSFGLIGMSPGEDHNATSYSTETRRVQGVHRPSSREDHNATSYSTETLQKAGLLEPRLAKIITLRAIALKRSTR